MLIVAVGAIPEDLPLEPHPEGIILPIRAQSGARRNGLGGEQDGQFKVAVTQVAEKGKANRTIIEVLCRELSLRKSQLIPSGRKGWPTYGVPLEHQTE